MTGVFETPFRPSGSPKLPTQLLENDICCHFPVVSCASLALLRHYCDKYAASMQQEQDDKNSSIVKENE